MPPHAPSPRASTQLERVAEAYTAALEEAAGGEAVRDAVREEIATAAAETGLRPDGDGSGRDRRAPTGGRPRPLNGLWSALRPGRSAFASPSGSPARAAVFALGRAAARSRSACASGWPAGSPTPWIMVDELIYSEMAKSFASSGHFLVRDAPSDVVSVAYPALISPAWWLHPMSTTYGAGEGAERGADDGRSGATLPLGPPAGVARLGASWPWR